RRHPEHDRVLDTVGAELLRLPRAAVIAAEADHRPAVVAARDQQVDLVASVRPHLDLVDRAGRRMHGEAGRRSMAEREDLRTVVRTADERVVVGDRAVVVEPQYLAAERIRILRVLRRAADERADVKLAVRTE